MRIIRIETILKYLLRFIEFAERRPQLVKIICNYLLDGELLLPATEQRLVELWEQTPSPVDMSRAKFSDFVSELKILVRNDLKSHSSSHSTSFELNLADFANAVGYGDLERDFLCLCLLYFDDSLFLRCFNDITGEHISVIEACAVALGVDRMDLNHCLQATEQLCKSGVLRLKSTSGKELSELYDINDSVRTFMYHSDKSHNYFLSLLGGPLSTSLDWGEFSHVEPAREKLIFFMSESLHKESSGINILLWGDMGTGKTEFCKVLALNLGAQLFAVCAHSDGVAEANLRERMDSYRLCQSLLKSCNKAVLMFDEADSFLEGLGLSRNFCRRSDISGAKTLVDQLLTQNPVPTFWIVDSCAEIDKSFIRRMSFVLEIKSPIAAKREQTLNRLLQRYDVVLPDEELRSLGGLNLPLTVVDSAARFAGLTGGGSEDFRIAANGIAQAMQGGRPLPQPDKVEKFIPSLIQTDRDLDQLTNSLVNAKSRAFSLCIYGPPGTGKSAYLRYLAAELNMPVLLKRASDLFSKWVGENEKNISQAFQDAVNQNAFLIFDEVDSLLDDRRNAARSWEVSQVNEMLTWMERHPLPFGCTTNLKERLDPASLRRFTFKCCFDYLNNKQIGQALYHFFGQSQQHDVSGLLAGRLTPGDFYVARRKAELLGTVNNPEEIFSLLLEEVKARDDRFKRRIGFCHEYT